MLRPLRLAIAKNRRVVLLDHSHLIGMPDMHPKAKRVVAVQNRGRVASSLPDPQGPALDRHGAAGTVIIARVRL